jgi:glycosyltransferase involved in cell wall biosynthesis
MTHPKNEPSEYADYFVSQVDYETPGLGNKLSSALKVLYSVEARRKIDSLLDVFTPDVAHLHVFQHQISPSILGPLKKRGIPVVNTLHDLKPICPTYHCYLDGAVCEACSGRRFYHCTLKKCTKGSLSKSVVNTVEMYLHHRLGYYKQIDHYIAVSRFYRELMIREGFSADRLSHVPNFVDISAFPLSEVDDGYVLYFGRLSDEKGVDLLVDCARMAPEIRFVIAGTGPSSNVLRTAAASLSNFNVVGHKTGSELTNLIGGCALTTLPATGFENCPMSVLESLAMGKPVIGARIGGIPELINEGHDGYCFVPGSADDCVRKIKKLLDLSATSRSSMGRKGREKVESEFTAESHYERLMSIYRSLI